MLLLCLVNEPQFSGNNAGIKQVCRRTGELLLEDDVFHARDDSEKIFAPLLVIFKGLLIDPKMQTKAALRHRTHFANLDPLETIFVFDDFLLLQRMVFTPLKILDACLPELLRCFKNRFAPATVAQSPIAIPLRCCHGSLFPD